VGASSRAVSDGGSTAGFGNLLSNVLGACGCGHGDTSEEGSGNNGETHLDYFQVKLLFRGD